MLLAPIMRIEVALREKIFHASQTHLIERDLFITFKGSMEFSVRKIGYMVQLPKNYSVSMGIFSSTARRVGLCQSPIFIP